MWSFNRCSCRNRCNKQILETLQLVKSSRMTSNIQCDRFISAYSIRYYSNNQPKSDQTKQFDCAVVVVKGSVFSSSPPMIRVQIHLKSTILLLKTKINKKRPRLILLNLLFFKWAILGLFFFIFVISIQLTINKCYI